MLKQFIRRFFYSRMRLNMQILNLQLISAGHYVALKEIRNDLLARSPKIGGEPFPSDDDIYLINKINKHLKRKKAL